jgi:HEAT repeat protein
MRRHVWVAGLVLLGLSGCVWFHPQTRLQADEESERDKVLDIKTVGTVTEVADLDSVPVSGVALVENLDGTGGSAPPGGQREMLAKELQRRGIENVHDVLTAPDNSMVLVSAMIPAGAHKGDPLDVEVVLPPGSKTTSLRGGHLQSCILYTYANAKDLAPNLVAADQLALGHPYAQAEGPLLVGFEDGDEDAKLRRGRIWGGARSRVERPLFLALKSDSQQARVAQVVAERINIRFQGAFRGTLADIAVAKSDQAILLTVPPQYKLNLPRFLRVVRLVPLQEGADIHKGYRGRLAELLLDPAHTITAALRLEALGDESVPILKRGLESAHPLVRFAAAEALAYLNNPACGDELAQLTEHQPRLRAFCLTALASLDQAVCHVKLHELLGSASAEVRYGAFRALLALDEHDASVQGELLNNSFWLHRVAPESPPLVHLAGSRRAEIILFGEEAFLVPPFSFLAGPEFTITAARDDEKCTISRFSVRHGTLRRQCSLKLEDVLRTLADLGGMYPDAVDLLRQADHCHSLTCRVAIDAMPQATEVEDLARKTKDDPDFQSLEQELLSADMDLGATPTLYDQTGTRRLRPIEDKSQGGSREVRKDRTTAGTDSAP